MRELPDSHPRNLGLSPYLPPALLGFAATSFQVYLIREFSVHFYGNEMTYGLVLGAWLFWGGMGSIFASKRKVPARAFWTILLLATSVFAICLAALRLSRFPLHLLPGEITGLSLMLPFALGLGLLASFPLGMLFVLAVAADKGNIRRVWIGESLGAALGGLIVSLVLIPYFSNWKGAALVGTVVCIAAAVVSGPGKRLWGAAAVAGLALAGLWAFDLPSQRLFWKPFTYLAGRDTPYGKLQVVRLKEQISLFDSGLPLYSTGDPASAEESVHFPFLQKPGAKKALLIGGGAGGGLAEALKYREIRIDYVELDPEIVRLSLQYLPEKEMQALLNPRVRIALQDGRSFLRSSRECYDLIILNLPEPATAQVNRFYTREFFELAAAKLSEGGVFSFRVPSAEIYLSPARRMFLATLYRTLKSAFRRVDIVPGDTNVFLASSAVLCLDAGVLAERVEGLGLETLFVRREFLPERLDPLRVSMLKTQLEGTEARLNSDLEPISYFYDAILWNSQFRRVEAGIMARLARLPKIWLLVPLLALGLLVLLIVPGQAPGYPLIPLLFLGLTQIVSEIMLLLWYQTLHGSAYGALAGLVASFMAGLFLGGVIGTGKKDVLTGRLIRLQAGMVLWLTVLYFLLKVPLPKAFFHLALLGLGILGGQVFITSNRLFLSKKQDYGLGYGLDLIGSFAGALAASAILVPLAGLAGLTLLLIALNAMTLAAVALKIKI